MGEQSVVRSVEERVERLIADHDRLQGECARLSAREQQLSSENRRLTLQLAQARKLIDRYSLSLAFEGGGEHRRQARARVNRLMREVDKCIALLNK